MNVAEQLLSARIKQGLTQDKLKTMAGISLDTLRRIEKGKSKNPSHFVISNLERALNIKFKL